MQVKKQQLEPDMEQLTGSKLGKEYVKDVSPCFFNIYAEYMTQNTRLDESQAGSKIAGRNINNLRYDVEKAMTPHSSTLAWRIPGTEKPGGLPSMGLHRVRHDWCDLAAVAAAA